MAIQNFFKKNPGWGIPAEKKLVLFTGHIEDNVKIFRFVDVRWKKTNMFFTDQIEDNQPNIFFRGYWNSFFLSFWGSICILSIRGC